MSVDSTTGSTGPLDVPKLTVSDEHLRLIEIWKAMSTIVHRVRHTNVPTASNGALKEHIRSDPDGLLSPFFEMWIADNYCLAGQYRNAIDTYRALASRYPERHFYGQALGAIALEQAAECHRRLGEPNDAIAALRQITATFQGACFPAWIRFRIGQIAERAGSYDEDIAAYRRGCSYH